MAQKFLLSRTSWEVATADGPSVAVKVLRGWHAAIDNALNVVGADAQQEENLARCIGQFHLMNAYGPFHGSRALQAAMAPTHSGSHTTRSRGIVLNIVCGCVFPRTGVAVSASDVRDPLGQHDAIIGAAARYGGCGLLSVSRNWWKGCGRCAHPKVGRTREEGAPPRPTFLDNFFATVPRADEPLHTLGSAEPWEVPHDDGPALDDDGAGEKEAAASESMAGPHPVFRHQTSRDPEANARGDAPQARPR